VWVADPIGRRVFRVLEGGKVTDSYAVADLVPVACVLGGPDRRTLFVCAAIDWKREVTRRAPTGRLLATEVDVPGAGVP
jgi:sugar lactone lactonase YvrE